MAAQLLRGLRTRCRGALLRRFHLGLRDLHQAAAQQQELSLLQQEQEDAIYAGSSAPPHFVHPALEVARVEGKGRGLLATRPVRQGDPILVVQPMAVLLGPQDRVPDADGLLDQLLPVIAPSGIGTAPSHPALRTRLARAWLNLLYAGDLPQQPPQGATRLQPGDSSTDADLRVLQRLLQQSVVVEPPRDGALQATAAAAAPDGLDQDPAVLAAGGAAPASGGDAASAAAWAAQQAERAARVLGANSFGDPYEDLAAAACRRRRRRQGGAGVVASGSSSSSSSSGEVVQQGAGAAEGQAQQGEEEERQEAAEEAQSHVGLWPHFSLLNHSCLPRCVHYVVGRTMVVRAVEGVEAGEELTVSYLGREDFSPASVRQELLHSRFGFTCRCARCELEAALPPGVAAVLAELHAHTKLHLVPSFMQALQDEDQDALKAVGEALVEWSAKLHNALADLKDLLLDAGAPHPPSTDASPPALASPPEAGSTPTLAAFAGDEDQEAQQQRSGAASGAAGVDLGRLRRAVEAVGGVDAAVLCLEAAVYGFVELLGQHTRITSAGGEGEGGDEVAEGALRLSADIMHAVSRGSELHVFLASRLLELATQQAAAGGDGAEQDVLFRQQLAVALAQGAEEALLCRYGRVSPALMVELAQLNADISRQFVV